MGKVIEKELELKFKQGNRVIIQSHVEKIKNSIRKHGYFDSKKILVNYHGEIIDGQHRYQACLELGIEPPVERIECFDDEVMVDLNITQKSWELDNYLHYFCSQGNPIYIRISEIKGRVKLPTSIVLSALIVSDGNPWDYFKSGQLYITTDDFVRGEIILSLAKHTASILKLQKPTKSIVRALARLANKKGFKFSKLEAQMTKRRDIMYPCHSTDSYIQMFKELYNYRTSKEARI